MNNWAKGDAVVFRADLPDGAARKGECFTVLAIEGEQVVLVHEDGRELEVKPRRQGTPATGLMSTRRRRSAFGPGIMSAGPATTPAVGW